VLVIGGAAALLTIADRDDAYDAVAAAADAETLELESDLGAVTVVYSPDLNQVGVLSTDLPDPGEGKTYELWLVVDSGVTPAGLFVPDDGDVRQVLSVDDVQTQGFGITIEPEGGSDQPTGDILFLDTFDT
jgi:anti-sigma-K factor RskA